MLGVSVTPFLAPEAPFSDTVQSTRAQKGRHILQLICRGKPAVY